MGWWSSCLDLRHTYPNTGGHVKCVARWVQRKKWDFCVQKQHAFDARDRTAEGFSFGFPLIEIGGRTRGGPFCGSASLLVHCCVLRPLRTPTTELVLPSTLTGGCSCHPITWNACGTHNSSSLTCSWKMNIQHSVSAKILPWTGQLLKWIWGLCTSWVSLSRMLA